MYCIKCGNEIPDGSSSCPSCDEQVKKDEPKVEQTVPVQNQVVSNPYDNPSRGLGALSLIIPPLGFIYSFMSKKEMPNRAKLARDGAIFGVVVYILAFLIFYFLTLPIVKRFALKYECVTNYPGAVYNYSTYTCRTPEGKEIQKIPK